MIPWIRYFGYVAIVPLVVAMALAIAAVGAIVAAWRPPGIASPFLTAAVWVVLEALRGRWPLGGFPWADLGVALHDVPAARAVAGVGGTLLVSYLIVVVNGLALDLGSALHDRTTAGCRPRRRRHRRGRAWRRWSSTSRASSRPRRPGSGSRCSRVTTSSCRWRSRPTSCSPRSTSRSPTGCRATTTSSCSPSRRSTPTPRSTPTCVQRITELAAEHDAAVLVNARTAGDDGNSRNTNLLYDPDGKLQGNYSKQHLVPFGEYVPWRDQLGFIGELRQVPYDFEPGDTRTHVRRGGARRSAA